MSLKISQQGSPMISKIITKHFASLLIQHPSHYFHIDQFYGSILSCELTHGNLLIQIGSH